MLPGFAVRIFLSVSLSYRTLALFHHLIFSRSTLIVPKMCLVTSQIVFFPLFFTRLFLPHNCISLEFNPKAFLCLKFSQTYFPPPLVTVKKSTPKSGYRNLTFVRMKISLYRQNCKCETF